MPINYSLYPPNWLSHYVPQVLKRANNCCEFCKLKNGSIVQSIPTKMQRGKRIVYRRTWVTDNEWNEGAKKVTVVLTIAHLDHDHWNFNVPFDRLKALCQLCHLRYDAAEKARKRKNKLETLRVYLEEPPNF